MSDYWTGFITIPAVLLLMALVATALFGAWLLFEKWATHRLQKLPPVKVTRKSHRPGAKFQLRSATDLGGRGIFAALLLSVDKVWFFQLGPNTGIGLVHGKGNQEYDLKFMHEAITKAVDEAAKGAEQ